MSKNVKFAKSPKTRPVKREENDNIPFFDIQNFLIAGFVILLVVLGYFKLSGNMKKSTISNLTVKSRPIISALEVYRSKKGEYPKSLDELVPGYIDEIPRLKSSIGSYQYSRMEDGQYELVIKFADGFNKYCYMVYRPDGKYRIGWPHYEKERVNDWVITGFSPE